MRTESEDWSGRPLTPKSTWSLLLLVGPRALMRHYYVLNPDQDSIDWECLVNNAITIIIPQLIKVIMAGNDLWEGGGGPSSWVGPNGYIRDLGKRLKCWRIETYHRVLEPSPDIDTLLAVLTLRSLIARLRQIELGLRVSDVCAGVRGQGSGAWTAVGKKEEEGEWFYGSSRKMAGSTICKWLVLIGNTPRPS